MQWLLSGVTRPPVVNRWVGREDFGLNGFRCCFAHVHILGPCRTSDIHPTFTHPRTTLNPKIVAVVAMAAALVGNTLPSAALQLGSFGRFDFRFLLVPWGALNWGHIPSTIIPLEVYEP